MGPETYQNDVSLDLSDLTSYIKEARAFGLSAEEIITELMGTGWEPETIKLGFMRALKVPYPRASQLVPAVTEVKRPIIEVKDLTKTYGDFIAVDGISFEVQPGETFGILGPNGAGKTTTLEMIEGLKKITSGTVVLDGKDVTQDPRGVKSVIGVQLQASSFFDELSLVELLKTFAALYGRTVDPIELLEAVQLSDKAKSKIKELSGGQKQRFSIAVGLVNDPKVLFLDEPTTGLDPQARRNLWELITKIKNQGKTIVLTTHYMEEAEVLCDRIAIMDHAKIVALDTTHKLLHSIGVNPTVEFKSNTSVPFEVLQTIPGVESVSNGNGVYVLSTQNPQKTLEQLFNVGREHNFHIDQLVMKRATLEDVFLKLTGHQLRE